MSDLLARKRRRVLALLASLGYQEARRGTLGNLNTVRHDHPEGHTVLVLEEDADTLVFGLLFVASGIDDLDRALDELSADLDFMRTGGFIG